MKSGPDVPSRLVFVILSAGAGLFRFFISRTLFHKPFRGFWKSREVEVEVGAEDVFGRVAGGVCVAGARFGEEEGVRDFFERLGAGEVEFVAAQLFAFRGYDCAAQRARSYLPQLEAYAWALSRVTGKAVRRRIVYFLSCGAAVEL